MEQTQQPQVKNYLDCFQFLQDIYRYHKTVSRDFSYQLWSHQLNIKSKSYLRFATLGRRKISETLCSKFIFWFDFNDSDKQYFTLLVQYTQATNPESKNMFSKQLLELIRLDTNYYNITKSSPVIDDPILFHIRDLISCTDVPQTTETLSAIFNRNISEMSQYLEQLKINNFILKNSDGFWMSTDESIKIVDHPKNKNLFTYHKKSLTSAIEQIENINALRKFRSLNFLLSESEFNEMNQKAYDFLTTLFNEYSQNSVAKGKKIYQLNYNISPRTDII
jgi:uncharacterized protein (TIGR02147 family)